MAYLGATMTLPGIAGFILTIGMGVDSNVLIFERIKEEMDLGQRRRAPPSTPASTGCGGRSSTPTSRRSSRPCCCCSSAPDRSAASPLTLIIGLLANVFTAVFVSRTMFELVLGQRKVQTLSI